MKMKDKRKAVFAGVLALCVLAAVFFFRFRDRHTFTLSDEPEPHQNMKSEEIRAIFGYVKVSSTQDTDVWFTDAQDHSVRYHIGYVTPGMPETVRLQAGHWYSVEAEGKITVGMVDLRIE